ncbi:hypothetical protein [Carnimonas bestiolae]|uniref:hypothetical protein n=1 Tax=Carnimonas bestiolae TaxID=3402172 RepID=UPI003F4AED9D
MLLLNYPHTIATPAAVLEELRAASQRIAFRTEEHINAAHARVYYEEHMTLKEEVALLLQPSEAPDNRTTK